MAIRQDTSGSDAELPFAIYNNNNVPQTGFTFSAGQVKIKAPGDVAFSNATLGNIVECGHGQYAVQLTSAQTASEGSVLVFFSDGTNRDFSNYEMIASSTDEVLEIPFSIYNGSGVGVTGFTFSPGDVEIRLPGGSFSAADEGNVVEYGLGQYALVLTSAQRLSPGAIMLFFSDGVNQDYFGYELNAADAGTDTTPADLPDPVPAPAASDLLDEYDHVAAMLDRLPEYARQEI